MDRVRQSSVATTHNGESGGPTALSVQRQSDDITTSTLGLRASTDVELGQVQARVYGTVGWSHAFGRVTPRQKVAFEGSRPFTVTGTPIARNSAVLELGTDLAVSSNVQIGLAYNAQLSGSNREHAGTLSVQWRF